MPHRPEGAASPAERKFRGTENEKYLTESPCGALLGEIFDCYHKSETLIKGLDCIGLFKDYHKCCRENENSCPDSISSIETADGEDLEEFDYFPEEDEDEDDSDE